MELQIIVAYSFQYRKNIHHSILSRDSHEYAFSSVQSSRRSMRNIDLNRKSFL